MSFGRRPWSTRFWLVCLLALCLMAGLPSSPRARENHIEPAEPSGSQLFVVQANADGKAASIPLGTDAQGVDLTTTVALTFKIRGGKGQEAVRFELTGSADNQTPLELGEVFQFLPLGISTDWKQAVVEIPDEAHKILPRAFWLTVRLNNEERGTIYLKDVQAIPRLAGSRDWQALAVPLTTYSIHSLDDISALVLDLLEGMGPRIQGVQQRDKTTATNDERAEPEAQDRNIAPRVRNGYYLVTDFDSGIPERLRGRFGAFVRPPSFARLDLSTDVRGGAGGRSLHLTYKKRPKGFCGLWIHLREKSPSSETVYLDATSFGYLSFWVRGEEGGEDALVQLADRSWEKRGDSVALGPLSEFLKGGVARDWQEVTISLKRAQKAGLDVTRLATLSLKFDHPGSGSLYLDDVALKTSRQVQIPLSPIPTERRAAGRHRRATWIWDPTVAFRDPKEWSTIFDFARRESIDVFFVQIHCNYSQVAGQVDCALDNEERFRRLVREAHREGIEVHALDGYKYYVLPHWQPKVRAQVRAVLDYNARVEPSERFDGIHHDNEPYLIRGFSGTLKEELLLRFLDLTYACQQLVIRSGQQTTYGVDIPFWYDGIEVTWRGVRKTMSAHTIDIVDNVGVMAYRTAAHGPNGVLALANEEIDYASRQGKRVFVALETTPLPDQVSYTFANGPTRGRIEDGVKPPAAYLLIEEWDGVGIFYWKEIAEDTAHVVNSALQEIGGEPETRRILLSVEKRTVPGSRLSFATSTVEELRAVVERIFEEFGDQAGFAGVAIHDYAGYRKLVQQP